MWEACRCCSRVAARRRPCFGRRLLTFLTRPTSVKPPNIVQLYNFALLLATTYISIFLTFKFSEREWNQKNQSLVDQRTKRNMATFAGFCRHYRIKIRYGASHSRYHTLLQYSNHFVRNSFTHYPLIGSWYILPFMYHEIVSPKKHLHCSSSNGRLLHDSDLSLVHMIQMNMHPQLMASWHCFSQLSKKVVLLSTRSIVVRSGSLPQNILNTISFSMMVWLLWLGLSQEPSWLDTKMGSAVSDHWLIWDAGSELWLQSRQNISAHKRY